VALTYTLLALYTAYSAALYAAVLMRLPPAAALQDWAHWLDVAWYTGLITLTSGTNSIFFFGFFFAILVASFRWGFASGMRVAVASAVLFSLFGYLTAPEAPEFEQRRFLIRPLYLLVLGSLVARWGGLEVAQRRRLEFLRQLSALSNPRLGIDHVARVLVRQLMALFEADDALILMERRPSSAMMLWRATAAGGEVVPRTVPAEISRVLFSPEEVETVAAVLEAEAFVTAPLSWHGRSVGVLYVTARRRRTFGPADGDFLLQIADHVLPLLMHMQLVEQLAGEAASEERRKIALDLHDSVIQPYVGLGLGLTALKEKLGSDEHAMRKDLDRLLEMVGLAVDQLRGRVLTLKESSDAILDLGPAVQRFAARFSDISGIDVQVDIPVTACIPSRMATDVFQMVAEGLSNVRRHTRAEKARLTLLCESEWLRLDIENDGWGEPSAAPFTPGSITERAATLGGRVRVERKPDGGARVAVQIPIDVRPERESARG
jgi:signal transduction histidine kinase